MGRAVNSTLLIVLLALIGCRTNQLPYSRSGFERAIFSTTEFPFQVLHAEGVRSKNLDSRIIRFDYISSNDTLLLTDAHLILVHYSGKFLEFEGDTAIVMSVMSDELPTNLNLPDRSVLFRPNLPLLFDFSNNYFFGSCGPSYYYNLIGFTRTSSTTNFLINDICLGWHSDLTNDDSGFIVTVRNIFDKEVAKFETTDMKIQLDLSSYDSLLTGGLAIVQVINRDNRDISSGEEGILLVDQLDYKPSLCEIKSAVDALEFACFLKWSDAANAVLYFEEAAKLSSKEVYKELYIWNDPTYSARSLGK